jgi:tetratricopeptide (TPR) repeat protein
MKMIHEASGAFLRYPLSHIEGMREDFFSSLAHLPIADMEAKLRQSIATATVPITDLWHALGHVHRAKGEWEAAAEAYTQAITCAARYHSVIHFEHSAMHLHRALVRQALGNVLGAEKDLSDALFQDHTNISALHLQEHGWNTTASLPSYTQFTMTARARASEICGKATDATSLTLVHQQMDIALAKKESSPIESMELLRHLSAHFPTDPLLWHRLGIVYYELGEWQEALHSLDAALTFGATYHKNYHRGAALHYLHRGQIYHHHLLQRDLAFMDYTRASDMDTSFDEAKKVLAALRGKKV